ncbi:FG-GAP-like repeat-containing protein [Cytobacillus praedii]|uniref:FG-GAP-like repeat-containing protein n=1 Tax=Cytobacillus praedii TaxID=1742358 RepID=UPI003F7DDF5D
MPCPSFQTSTFLSGSVGPVNLVVADFNGDGNPDLAITNQTSANISVFLGNGSGGFAPAPGSPFSSSGLSPDSIISDDFNGDGFPDLAVVNGIGNTVSVFLGNGTGTFALAPGSPFSSAGLSASDIASADFNGDGIPDLAVSNQDGNVAVFIGNGNGSFVFSTNLLSASPTAVISDDFNGDGFADLAVSNSTGTIAVFLGNGAGAFALGPGSPFPSGGSVFAEIIATDFNGDGFLDLAVTDFSNNAVSVLLGNGTGAFALAAGSPFPTGGVGGTRDITFGEFNCDGIPDIAVTNTSDGTISLLLGNGTGGFTLAPGSPFSSGGLGPTSLASADFNGDGLVDLAVTNFTSGTISILLNDCEPEIVCPADITVANDLNQCGAVVNYPAPTVSGNCIGAIASCSPGSGSFFPVGTTMVTCTLTDPSGIVVDSCSFNVTVEDTQAPNITCSDDIMTSNAPGQCGAFVDFPAPITSDNCPGVMVSCSPASGTFFSVGNTPVICTATDSAGNTAECSFTVTIVDSEPPMITCSDDITVFNDPGSNGAFVSFPDPIVIDNCPGATTVCTPASGSFFPRGTTAVTCTATDAAGNISACSFNVIVIVDPCRFFSGR